MGNVTASEATRTYEQRLHQRWDRNDGPGGFERWTLGAPWRQAVVLAVMFGVGAGWRYVSWDAAPGPRARAVVVVASLALLLLVPIGWRYSRRHAVAYADWARSRGLGHEAGRPGVGVWILATVVALVSALAYVAVVTRPTPAPPPDGAEIGRAIAGSGGAFYELLPGDRPATGPGELSLVESGLEPWHVATRDADGGCHALRFRGGELDRLEPLGEPCTGEHAAATSPASSAG